MRHRPLPVSNLDREPAAEARLGDIERFIAGSYPALVSFTQGKTAGELARAFVSNSDRPPATRTEQARSSLLLDGPGAIVGLLQIYEGHPTASSWYVGLLVLDPSLRGQGHGSHVVRDLLGEADRHRVADIRVAIDSLNVDALRFWHGLGFDRIEKIVTRDPGYTLVELVNRRGDHPAPPGAAPPAPAGESNRGSAAGNSRRS
jgi:ribosomal protein S18 acetylase RimI-like enzyme